MTKNETELIIRRARGHEQLMLGRLQARNAHRTDLAYCQQPWRRSFQSVRGRKPSLRLFPAPSPTQVAPLSPASALRLSAKALD